LVTSVEVRTIQYAASPAATASTVVTSRQSRPSSTAHCGT
jgi:hypothetical protein